MYKLKNDRPLEVINKNKQNQTPAILTLAHMTYELLVSFINEK